MADAGACRRAEKKNPGSHTGKDVLISMMTGFVQNIEIFCLFSAALFPLRPGKKAVQIRPVRLSGTVLCIFIDKI